MKRDLVYILIDGEDVQAFGNLKTLLETILASEKYSTVWRSLEAGNGRARFGSYTIERTPVIRAPFAMNTD